MMQLVITLDEKTGQIQVTGPIKNKILSYGILKSAEYAIANMPVSDPKLVQIANAAIGNGHPKP